MNIDLDIEKLICFWCKNYLSVFPIKVYPTRLVKCGRCHSDDTDGTVSKLYETIAREVKFPCVNWYKGCQKFLKPEEMVEHERTCLATSLITCPLCSNCEVQSSQFIQHFKQKHPDNYLNCLEFPIYFNSKNEEIFYWHEGALDYSYGIIYVKYDSVVKKLSLNFLPITKKTDNFKQFIMSFNLYTVDRKLMYTSQEKKCVKFNAQNVSQLPNSFNVFIEDTYPKHIAICKFVIQKGEKNYLKNEIPKVKVNSSTAPQPKLSLSFELPMITQEVIKPCVLSHEPVKIEEPCQLKHHGANPFIYQFKDFRSLQGRKTSPIFYVGKTTWKIFFKKWFNRKTVYLSLYLEKEDDDHAKKHSFKVNAEVAILSEGGNNFTGFLENQIFGHREAEGMAWGWPEFISWSELLDPNKNYVNKDNSIRIEVKVTILEVLEHNPQSPIQQKQKGSRMRSWKSMNSFKPT